MLRNWKKWVTLGIAIICFASFTYAETSFSLTIGTDNFYASVGNYDYFPYAYSESGYGGYNVPRINFYDVMSDYGFWVDVAPFGRVWRPYASATWRPYVQGHWIYTSYGPTWVGYEPWAWAGYHYGNWILTPRYGWVWIPGYDWHPGRVQWSHGYDAIGWMPAPPWGYDYSRGYISYRGDYNQFAYDDNDFDYSDDYGYDQGNYYQYGGPYYDPRYRDLYYNPGYNNIVINLWVFIGTDHFGHSNYSDYYLDRDFTRNVFERRLVRISSKPLERPVLERVVKQRIREVAVQVKEIDTDKKRIKMIVPEGEDKEIRENANRVVKDVIAPGFVKERKNFKGLKARNAQLVNKMFEQENKRPEVRNVSGDDIVKEAKTVETQKEEKRGKLVREKADRVIQIEKEGKIHEMKDRDRNKKPDTQLEKPAQDKNKGNIVPREREDRNQDRDKDQQFEKRSSDKEKERGNSDKLQRDVEQKKRDSDVEIQNERERSKKQKDEEQQQKKQDQDRIQQRNDRDRQRNDEDQKINDRRSEEDKARARQNADRDRQRNDEDQKINDRRSEEQDKDRVVDKKASDSDNKKDSDKKEDSGKKNKKNSKDKDKKHNQNDNEDPDNNR